MTDAVLSTVRAAAQILNLEPTKVHNLITSGDLAARYLGDTPLIERDSITRYAEQIGATP